MDLLVQCKKTPIGDKMGGKPLLIKLKNLGYNLPEQFACFPPIILDNVSTFWAPYTFLALNFT